MPLTEVEHLVEHHVGEALDPGDAVADLADDADALPGRGGLGAGDLGFDFLHQVSHDRLPHSRTGVTDRASRAAEPGAGRCRRRRRCRP